MVSKTKTPKITFLQRINSISRKQKIILILCLIIIIPVVFIVLKKIVFTQSGESTNRYTSTNQDYQFSYNGSFVIPEQNGYGVKLHTTDVGGKIVTFTVFNHQSDFVPYNAYPICSSDTNPSKTPCIYSGWGSSLIENTTLGGVPAKSFYMTFGERDPDNNIISYKMIETEKQPKVLVKISVINKTVNPFFNQVLSTFTLNNFQNVPASASLVPYHSAAGGYSVKVPTSWYVTSMPDTIPGHMAFDPVDEIGVHLNGITIDVVTPSDKDREWVDRFPNDSFTQRVMTDTQIAGYKALIKYQVHQHSPLRAKAVDWYNGPDKQTYVYINNNTAILFQAKWDKQHPEYEALMDDIVTSLQVDH